MEDFPKRMFATLEKINERPAPFQFYTAAELWTDPHTSKRMLAYHLDDVIDVSSRNGRFIERSVAWIASRFNVARGTAIADLGCGPGLYATRLAKCHAEVTGVDFSPRSIAHARQAAIDERLNIDFVACDYLDYAPHKRFDLVLMIMCDYCALSPDQRKAMRRTFHKILKPGGSVLLDVYSMAAYDAREETAAYQANLLDGFWSPEKYYGFLNTFKYDDVKVVLDKYTIVEANRTRTVYNWLQYFTPEELEREFVDSGFAIADRYSDVAGAVYDPEHHEFAIIAEKAA